MAKNRSLIACIAAFIVLALVYWSCPAPVYKPHGIFLPGVTYHPYPQKQADSVRWFTFAPTWSASPVLGTLSFEYYDPSQSVAKRDELVAAMKQAAAKVGGNVIVKKQLFNTARYGAQSGMKIWLGQGHVMLNMTGN